MMRITVSVLPDPEGGCTATVHLESVEFKAL